MAQYDIGDIVTLTAGSMRMAVESVDGETVNTVWCHEGTIGRDSFHQALLRKWEDRDPAERSGGAPRGGHKGDRSGPPRGKPGWDGKPREKKYFRKD